MIPEILNGFEGHTKEKLVRFNEIKEFVSDCISNKNGLEMDDLISFIDEEE